MVVRDDTPPTEMMNDQRVVQKTNVESTVHRVRKEQEPNLTKYSADEVGAHGGKVAES
jgi:hypothetical protein